MKLIILLLAMITLPVSCAGTNLPDGLDKNNTPSGLEMGRNEEMDIPERDDRPGVQNPLREQKPQSPPTY